MTPIHITYEHNSELSYDFAIHFLKSKKLLKIGMVVLVAVLIVQSLMLGLQEEPDTNRILSTLFPLAFLAVVWFWIIPKSFKKQIARSEASSNQGSHREYIFEDDYLTVRTETSASNFEYEGLVQVDASERCYFLYIANNQALIIPKSALSSDEEQAILSLLEEKGVLMKV